MTTILGIEVSEAALARMAALLAPVRQPFWGSRDLLGATGSRVLTSEPAKALCDTFGLFGDDAREPHVLIDESAFLALSRPLRARLVRAQVLGGRDVVPSVRAWPGVQGAREQADGHRFVWWPSLLEGREAAVVSSWVAMGQKVSRHREVSEAVWRKAAGLLPGARDLAGTFALGADANCFATVMAAAGERGAAERWMKREPFEDFLSDRTKRGGSDDEPGTVLVWRSREGLVEHACVTLGGGWALTKANQSWHSPRSVLTVREAILDARTPGRRLTRRRLR